MTAIFTSSAAVAAVGVPNTLRHDPTTTPRTSQPRLLRLTCMASVVWYGCMWASFGKSKIAYSHDTIGLIDTVPGGHAIVSDLQSGRMIARMPASLLCLSYTVPAADTY